MVTQSKQPRLTRRQSPGYSSLSRQTVLRTQASPVCCWFQGCCGSSVDYILCRATVSVRGCLSVTVLATDEATVSPQRLYLKLHLPLPSVFWSSARRLFWLPIVPVPVANVGLEPNQGATRYSMRFAAEVNWRIPQRLPGPGLERD